MKFFLTSVCILALSASPAFSQSSGQNNHSRQDSELYPIHVTDQLNNSPMMRELNKKYPHAASAKKAKAVADEVGDLKMFWVYNFNSDDFVEREFKLLVKGDASQIWFEVNEIENGHLTEDIADSLYKSLEVEGNSDSFDPNSGIVKLSNDIFGEAPDKDGDDKVDFLVTDIRDGWAAGSQGGYIAGFFYSIDQYNQSQLGEGQYSNERDVLYIDSYPGITAPNSPTNPARPLPTLAHEYQHLIHFKYNNNAFLTPEFTFINEGQSNFAALLNGYFPHPSYNSYLADTNVPLFRWNSGGNVLPDYGRAASFHSYMWDQLGFENAGHLTQSLLSGVDGIDFVLEEKLGSSLTFRDILVNWGVANLVNNKESPGDEAFGYAHPFLDDLTASGFSIVEPLIGSRSVDVQQGGIEYIGLKSISDIEVNVTFEEEFGEVRFITVQEGNVEVYTMESGQQRQTEDGVVFDDAYLMFVNTEPGADGAVTTETLTFNYNINGMTVTSNEDERNLVPENFSLNQNYPNPFNPSTNISFSLPEATQVTLSVFDYTGRKVATLVDNRLSAGSHTFNWDASNMSSGVYLYKIEAGDFYQTKKMILLK